MTIKNPKTHTYTSPMLLGTKLGMTRVYDENGNQTPVTVVRVGPCVVTQIRTQETDGYDAVQVGFEDVKARNSTMPVIGHDHKAGTTPKRHHREFRCDAATAAGFEPGQQLTAEAFASTVFVDVAGRSKGKGFQGGVKRHGFKGQQASHGVERKHRSPGSIGGHASNAGLSGRIKKGKKMSGHMGDERVTVRCVEVVRVVPEENLVLLKGPVPGANKGVLEIRPSVRLRPTKAEKQAAASS